MHLKHRQPSSVSETSDAWQQGGDGLLSGQKLGCVAAAELNFALLGQRGSSELYAAYLPIPLLAVGVPYLEVEPSWVNIQFRLEDISYSTGYLQKTRARLMSHMCLQHGRFYCKPSILLTVLFLSPPIAPILTSSPYAHGASVPE